MGLTSVGSGSNRSRSTSNYPSNESIGTSRGSFFSSVTGNRTSASHLSSPQKDLRLSKLLLVINQKWSGNKQDFFTQITNALELKDQTQLELIESTLTLNRGYLQQIFSNSHGQLGKTHSYYVLYRILGLNDQVILRQEPRFFAQIAKRAQIISNAVQFIPNAQQTESAQDAPLGQRNSLDNTTFNRELADLPPPAAKPEPSRVFIQLDEALNLDKSRSEALSEDKFNTLWKSLDAKLSGATDTDTATTIMQPLGSHAAGLLLQLLHHKKDAQQ